MVLRALLLCCFFAVVVAAPVAAGPMEDCASTEPARSIAGCTKLLKSAKLKKAEQSLVYSMRGLANLNGGNPQAAIKDLEQAAKLDGKNFQAYQGLGFALQTVGIYPESVAAFDKAIALNPSDHITVSYRGYSHLMAKNYTTALADFDSAVKLDPKNPAYQTARGDALKKLKAFPIAIDAYGKAIALNPNYPDAYEGRGLVHLLTADAASAKDDFDTSIKLKNTGALSFAGRAEANAYLGNADDAEADANAALKLVPSDSYYQAALALSHFAREDFAAATKLYEQALTADPKSSRIIRGLARSNFEMGDADKAIILLDTALLQSPDDLSAYAPRGHAVLKKGRVDEAIANFEKALGDNTLDGEAAWGLGLAYEQKGDLQKARLNLEESLKPYRLLPFQKKRAEAALQNLGGGKTNLEAEVAVVEEPAVKLPVIPVDAGSRVALVIGNGRYENANPLVNPTKDSKAIAQALRALGFEVLEGADLKHADMQGVLRDFAKKATEADVALFYYAGHGMQVGDKNYLVPVDAKLEEATAVDFELVDVNKSVVQYLGGESKTGIIILDACRNNPLARSFSRSFGKTRSGTVAQGMAPMTAEDGGLLIAFATAPGDVAEDGEGQNSPFTTALLAHMNTPGLELELMMKRVKRDVFASTKKRQQPWVNSALRDDVFLAVK
jgi:tetratricopeptide (TPR) repeat protein